MNSILPDLIEMIPFETWSPILTAIDGIQAYCKYYNNDIYQAYLEAQEAARHPPQNNDRSQSTIAQCTPSQIESLAIMTDKAPIFNQQNATIRC